MYIRAYVGLVSAYICVHICTYVDILTVIRILYVCPFYILYFAYLRTYAHTYIYQSTCMSCTYVHTYSLLYLMSKHSHTHVRTCVRTNSHASTCPGNIVEHAILSCGETVEGTSDQNSDSGVSIEEGKEEVNGTLFSPMYQFFDNSGESGCLGLGTVCTKPTYECTYVRTYV